MLIPFERYNMIWRPKVRQTTARQRSGQKRHTVAIWKLQSFCQISNQYLGDGSKTEMRSSTSKSQLTSVRTCHDVPQTSYKKVNEWSQNPLQSRTTWRAMMPISLLPGPTYSEFANSHKFVNPTRTHVLAVIWCTFRISTWTIPRSLSRLILLHFVNMMKMQQFPRACYNQTNENGWIPQVAHFARVHKHS